MAHSVKLIALGFAVLAACLVTARLIGGPNVSTFTARAALVFIALWFVGAAINMWIGVAKAGYSAREEAPIFLMVFLVPAAVALLVWWKYSRS